MPLRIALDGPGRSGDPLSRIAKHSLHGLGASAQRVCFATRRSKAVEYPLDRRELLLRRAGGLLGDRGDLLHRFAQLLGRRGLRQSARKFLGCRGDSFEENGRRRGLIFFVRRGKLVRGVDFDAVRTEGGSRDRVAIFELLTSAMWYPSLNTHETRNGDQRRMMSSSSNSHRRCFLGGDQGVRRRSNS